MQYTSARYVYIIFHAHLLIRMVRYAIRQLSCMLTLLYV